MRTPGASHLVRALDGDTALQLDPGVDGDELTRLLSRVQAGIDQLTGLQAVLTRAVQLSGTHRHQGAAGIRPWLVDQLQVSTNRAGTLARVAGAIEDLPETAQRLLDGRLDLERADTIARATRRGRLGTAEETDALLAERACQLDASRLRQHVERTEHATDGLALARDAERARSLRELRFAPAEGGLVRFRGVLEVESAERLRTTLDALEHPDPDGTPDEQRRTAPKRLADALVDLSTLALRDGLVPKVGGVRPHLSVVIDAADLGDPRAGGVGVTGFGGDLDVQAVRRLLCDADVTRIVMAGASQVLDVGRATQTWSAPQRRALVARDGGCRGPGCDRPAGWCDAHHIQWWTRDQGPTSVDNGILLCEAHHDLVHHHGWTLDLDLTTATATWHPPDDGPPLLTHPHRPDIHLRPAA